MVFDFEKDVLQLDADSDDRPRRQGFGKETVLELIENTDGEIVLRENDSTEDPLVTISFSDKVQDMLGSEAQFIGHQMIHAAIQAVMHKQVNQWHANVYDEEPEHFS